MATKTCPKGFREITNGENATVLVALHNWENTLDVMEGRIPREFADFFDSKAGGAKGIPRDEISDFAEKLNTSLVCIEKK